MGLFQQAVNRQAFAKIGILGFQGAGKTFTGVQIALGLHAHISSTKPVMFLDTETGSDWALPLFREAGIELWDSKSRAFADLVGGIDEAEGVADILIIDSVSHYWRELMESYKRKHRITGRLAFHHWGPIKEEWGKFSERFVNSRVHIIVCGRAAWEYDYEQDEEGKKELIKTGTKMRAEGEFGYEPSLVIEMERIRLADELDGKPVGKVGAPVVHRAHVIKDRRMDARSMDGLSFDNPTFQDFLPHIEALNLGGEHVGIDSSRTSDGYLEDPDYSRAEAAKLRKIALEEIEETCKAVWPSTGAKDKTTKIMVLDHIFGTKSWTAIQGMHVMDLEGAAADLRVFQAQATDETLLSHEAIRELLDDIRKVRVVPISDEEAAALLGGVQVTNEELKAADVELTADTDSADDGG